MKPPLWFLLLVSAFASAFVTDALCFYVSQKWGPQIVEGAILLLILGGWFATPWDRSDT